VKALAPRALGGLAKEAFAGWKADNCLSMGAALAFYSLLSMAPLLVLVITIAGLVIGRDEAQTLLMTQLSGLLGDTGAEGFVADDFERSLRRLALGKDGVEVHHQHDLGAARAGERPAYDATCRRGCRQLIDRGAEIFQPLREQCRQHSTTNTTTAPGV